MFEQYFGLSENPFNVTPDPKFLFLSKAHEEALSYLRYGIDQRKGFIMITGEVGAGKTTICRALLGGLPKTVRTALVLNPALSDIELLQTINQDFGLNASPISKKALLDELYEFLINVFIAGENAVLIIDECQNLSVDVLEQIRMLSNLETEKEKLLQIVLVGQPELVKVLASPNMKQLDDRIVLRYHIWPLSLRDTRSYINHRLIISGAHGDITFTALAFRLIYRYSRGIPRRINAVAERSLLMAYLKATKRITSRIVFGAIRELQGNYSKPKIRPALIVPVLSALAVLMAVIVWPGVFSTRIEVPGTKVSTDEKRIAASVQGVSIQPQALQNVTGVPAQSHVTPRRDSKDWIMPDYNTALDILSQLPDGLAGPDALNLHPQPDYLKYLPSSAIVSMDGGYLVMLKTESSFVRVVGKNRAVIEIPLDEFKNLYRWNVIVPYAKPLHETVYSLNTTGNDVEKIQKVLFRLGMLAIMPDGVYGVETVQGVEKFQEVFGLKRDGVAGPETLVLLRNIAEGVK
jgi:general secretion pathway protein A